MREINVTMHRKAGFQQAARKEMWHSQMDQSGRVWKQTGMVLAVACAVLGIDQSLPAIDCSLPGRVCIGARPL